MEKPKSAMEKLNTLLGIIGQLVGTLLGLLTLSNKLPLPALGAYQFLWLGLALLLISVGIWLLCLGLGSKSRLLQPDRFIIQPDEPRHLKGREEEIQELAELCECNPLVFLEGDAGSGKSALIRGGFIEKCRQRRLLQPLYIDLSGAPWEDGLTALLANEAWHSLTEGERTGLDLKIPPTPGAIFSHLAAMASRLGRTMLLVFDQFDDYQSAYRERFREGSQGNTWITKDALVRIHSFWAEVDRLVRGDRIRCLFVTRADSAAGLDTVRFVEARTCRLTRVERNLIAPLLDEIRLPGPDGRAVVAHPQKGWEVLKGRLMADIAEDDRVLPVQLSVVLQALHRLPALTVREYERRGGAEGLERLYIESNISEAARLSGLSLRQVRKILLAMVEPSRSKTLQQQSSEILSVLERESPPDRAAADGLQKAMECLEGRGILRRRPSGGEGEDVWLLRHDFLCRGVVAAERFADRWGVLLHEHASQFREIAGAYRRWRALLSPWQQVRLALARLAGKFHYAGERRYALLSIFRFMPYLLLLITALTAYPWYRNQEDELRAERLFASIEGWVAQDAAGNEAASESFRELAASSERVRWKVLRLAFAGEESARRTEARMPNLLRLCLRLDPRGELRKRFWREVARPALEKDAGANVISLALRSWKEAPGDSADTQFLAKAVGKLGKAKEWSWLSDRDAWYFARLAPHMEPALAQTLAGEILDAMRGHAPMKNGVHDLQYLEVQAKALTPLAPRLSSEQAGTLADTLSTVLENEKKAGETWGANEGYRSGVFGKLAEPLLVCASRLDSVNPQILAETVANIVKFKSQLLAPYWRRNEGASQTDLARVADMLKGLSESQRAATADRLLNDLLEEKYPFRQSSLARGLKMLVGDDAMGLQRQAVNRLLTTLASSTYPGTVLAISTSLGDYASMLSPEQGRHAVERLLQIAENEKNYQGLGSLGQALGILAPWLQENEAQRICTRLVEGAAAQPPGVPFVQEALKGLPALASRLSADQVHSLMTALVTDDLKEAATPSGPLTAKFMAPCLKELAGLLGPDQVRFMGQTLVDAIEGEKDVRRLYVWCELVPAVADRLEAQQRRRICARLVESTDLPFQLAVLKAWVDPEVLNKTALRLIDSAARDTAGHTQLRMADALAVLVDRLPAECARRAAKTAVGIFLESEKGDGLITHVAELPTLDGIMSEPAIKTLAERVAQKIEQSASKIELFAYVIREPEKARNVTALLRHASDQSLLDILKQPFAVGDVQSVVLRTFEQKYERHFDDDLWHFLQWAASDPRTQNLDFHSPPRPVSSGDTGKGAHESN